MPNQEPILRGDIMAKAEIPRDVMTFWVRGGVLRPIAAPTGTGFKLRFPWYEANIAAIMNQLRILGVKIEGMLSIGRVYREAIAYFDGFGLNRDQVFGLRSLFIIEDNLIANDLKRAELRDIVNSPGFDRDKHPRIVEASIALSEAEQKEELKGAMLASAGEIHGEKRLTREIVEIRERVKREDFYRHVDAYLTVTEQPKVDDPAGYGANLEEMTYFWRTGEDEEYRFAWGAEASGGATGDGAKSMIAVDVTAVLYEVWNRSEDRTLA
jgi:hypothetical protein